VHNIPEGEARSLLNRPLQCEGCEDWAPLRVQPGSFSVSAGVLDDWGAGTQLQVVLDYRNSHKTKVIRYIFSVFRRQPYGRDRVYQLDVLQTRRPVKDQHKRSHEHFGDARLPGAPAWADWDYDEVLAYFFKQTNIKFDPKPPHPEHFQLRG
jgi:hypothetical protein